MDQLATDGINGAQIVLSAIDARAADTTFASSGCPQRQTETNDHLLYLHSFLLVEFEGEFGQSKLKA